MKPTLKITIGVIAVLVGLGFVMPAVALWRTQGSLPAASIGLLMLGLVLTVAGLYAGATGVRRSRG